MIFFFFFFSLLFIFDDFIGLLFMGILNLLKVVNETRLSSCKAQEARQFFRLLLKPNVHCVWLAKGGRKRLRTMRHQLIIHSIMHGTNLISTELDNISVFFFKLQARQNTKKKGCDFEAVNIRCMVYIKKYN